MVFFLFPSEGAGIPKNHQTHRTAPSPRLLCEAGPGRESGRLCQGHVHHGEEPWALTKKEKGGLGILTIFPSSLLVPGFTSLTGRVRKSVC